MYCTLHVHRYAEPKMDKAIREEGAAAWRLHHESQLSRVYPGGMRMASSNYEPFPFWEAGMQMVALNFQTNEMQLRANRSLFAQNGGCNSAGLNGAYNWRTAAPHAPPLAHSKIPATAAATPLPPL